MAAEEEPWHICLVLVRTRRRAGRPLRVIHLYWPRKDIVRCESTREVIQERGEDHA
jgi:hypothetical protein